MKVQCSLLWPCAFALALLQPSLAAFNPRQFPPRPITSPQPPSDTASLPPTATQTTPPILTTPPVTTPTTTDTQTTTTQLTASNSTTLTTPTASTPITPVTPTSDALPPTTDTAITTTGADGAASTIIVTTNLPSPTAALPTNTSAKEEDDGGGLSTGSIIGMSVAAGVAVIGIVGFFIWKFTRKRFSDFDDNEAIKWPELNSHTGNPDVHTLPARETGRVGFDSGSEADLSRVNSTSNYSTPDFNTGPDPYAVPPLPHLNPNQPYRDDPSGASGYYDPYRGPVPGTIETGAGDWHPEAYPMTQLGGTTGRASPGVDPMYGRQSPGPHGMYAGRSSPAPQVAYAGRGSPGPQVAYGAGRMSPGPNVAYDAYGTR